MSRKLPFEYQMLGLFIAICVSMFFFYIVANAFPGGLDWDPATRWFTIGG